MISIIIPVYNAEKYLADCLDSIKAQSYTDFEVIMVDDGSKDDSANICRRYAADDDRFVLMSQENAGPGAARNAGLEKASGEFVCFIDADDWIDADYLSRIMDPALEGYDAVMWGYTKEIGSQSQECKSRAVTVDDKDGIHGELLRLMQKGLYGLSVVTRFKRSIIEKYGIRMDTRIKLHEDCIFTNWYCMHTASLYVLDYAGYHYLIDENSLCRRKFFPTDEMLRIAELIHDSTKVWLDVPGLGNFVATQYLSKLSLSVKDMYSKEDVPQKPWNERMQRIEFAKSETKRLYGKLLVKEITHKLFRWMPAIGIEIMCRLQSK